MTGLTIETDQGTVQVPIEIEAQGYKAVGAYVDEERARRASSKVVKKDQSPIPPSE